MRHRSLHAGLRPPAERSRRPSTVLAGSPRPRVARRQPAPHNSGVARAWHRVRVVFPPEGDRPRAETIGRGAGLDRGGDERARRGVWAVSALATPGGRIRGVDSLGLEPLVGTLLSPPVTGPARNDMRRALHLTSCSRKSWGHSERPTLSCRRSSPRSREWRFARCRLVDLDPPSRCSPLPPAGSRVALNRMGAQRLDRPVNPSAQRCGTEFWYPARGQQRPRGPIPGRESVVELSAPSEITPIRVGDAPDRVACSRRLSRLRDPAV